MTLDDFLIAKNLSSLDCAKSIGVTGMTVHRYRKRQRKPKDEIMAKIYEFSGGLVTPDDFYDLVVPGSSSVS